MSAFEHNGIKYDFPDQPQVEGWEFKAYRRVRYEEHYYCNGTVLQWGLHENTNGCYWIATRVELETKQRKIVRRKISNDTGWLRYDTEMGWEDLDTIWREFNFIGFVDKNGRLFKTPIQFWHVKNKYYTSLVTPKDIESGAVEIRHAVSALFWEDE